MSMVIRQNMMTEAALRNLGQSYGRMHKSIERLSSGLRIVGADDDAAGLAVREGLRAEVQSLEQGIRNANDGISMLQTFDAAAQVIDEKLIRMKELAMQAATGTYSDSQRIIMQQEFSAMRAEITRIAKYAAFNQMYGLDGTTSSIRIHFGAGHSSARDYYFVDGIDLTASGLQITNLDISNTVGAQSALSQIDSAIQSKVASRAHFGAMMNRLQNTITATTMQRESLMAAESRISDVDVATEMSSFVGDQILVQAGVSMLMQANMVPQMAMQLLT